jgi:hypothetical protein
MDGKRITNLEPGKLPGGAPYRECSALTQLLARVDDISAFNYGLCQSADAG